jgi:hypothetical protein
VRRPRKLSRDRDLATPDDAAPQQAIQAAAMLFFAL